MYVVLIVFYLIYSRTAKRPHMCLCDV